MLKVKVNNQHDYISLRLVEAKDRTMNLTWSFGGDKCSGKVEGELMNRAIKAFSKFRDTKGGFGSLGEKMSALEVLANTCETINQFVERLVAIDNLNSTDAAKALPSK